MNDLTQVVSKYTDWWDDEIGLRGVFPLQGFKMSLGRDMFGPDGDVFKSTGLPQNFIDTYSKHSKWNIMKAAAERVITQRNSALKAFDDRFTTWVEGSQKFLATTNQYHYQTQANIYGEGPGVTYKGAAKKYLDALESLESIQDDVQFLGGEVKGIK